jgi:hypothetical protein
VTASSDPDADGDYGGGGGDAHRAVAINVGANTTLPGFRAPVWPDGRFEYVPIPEREPVAEPVATYGELSRRLGWETGVSDVADRAVHLDPEFPEAGGERYTYGDEHGVKAAPLSELRADDRLYFYATLSPVDPAPWQAPDWGAYLIGVMTLARDAVTGQAYRSGEAPREPFRTNAHVRRAEFDARVLIDGDPERSWLFERGVALSTREAGSDANPLVTHLSNDSGKGPWWRRPLRYDPPAAARLQRIVRERSLHP